MTETANSILGKHRPAKKPWVTDNILKLCNKQRELKQKKIQLKVQTLIKKPTRKLKRHEKSKGDMDWRTIQNTAEKQQQESLPICERTDTLEAKENYYHLGQNREMSHRRTRHSKEVDRVLFWTVYTHNNRRSHGARCPFTNQQWQLPYPVGRSWSGSKITEERQVGRNGKHSTGAGPGRRRGHDRYVTYHLQ